MAWYNKVTIEISLVVCVFSAMLHYSLATNFNISRICYVLYENNEADCNTLGIEKTNYTEVLEKQAQTTLTKINMVTNILGFVNLVYLMYVGIWVDKFGRKPFIVISLVGITLNSMLYMIFAIFHEISPWWFLTLQLPSVFIGNLTVLMAVLSVYMTDITTKENRMMRMAIFQVLFGSGQFLGTLLSSYIFEATSYTFCFGLTTVMLVLSTVHAIICIPESLKGEKEVFEAKKLLTYINFVDIIKSPLEKRPNNGRTYLLLTILIIIWLGLTTGETQVVFLFLRAKMGWLQKKITTFNSVTGVGGIFATGIGTYVFYTKLKIREIPIAIFSISILIVVNLLRAFATSDVFIYIAGFINLFSSLGVLMLKTLITFLIAPDEVGKIIALLDIATTLLLTLANFVYPLVYNATLDTNPGFYNFISVGVNAVGILALTALYFVKIPYYVPPAEEKSTLESTQTSTMTLDNDVNEEKPKISIIS